MGEPLIDIRNLTVDFDTGHRIVRALHGIDLAISGGEAGGLVGESGSGKRVTWLAALGLLGGRARIDGQVLFEGRNLVGATPSELEAVRGARIAMIFQDPSSSLNPVYRIGQQLAEALRLHRGMTGAVALAEAGRLLDRVGLADAVRGLLAALPELEGPRRRLVAIPGVVPEPWNLPPGCSFAPRCAEVEAACAVAVPPAIELLSGHRAACIHAHRAERE